MVSKMNDDRQKRFSRESSAYSKSLDYAKMSTGKFSFNNISNYLLQC